MAEMSRLIEKTLVENSIETTSGLTVIETQKAIEIVRNAGEEVCEWRIVDRPNGFPIYNTSCGAIRLNCVKGIDTYCNACGRKIKVVE